MKREEAHALAVAFQAEMAELLARHRVADSVVLVQFDFVVDHEGEEDRTCAVEYVSGNQLVLAMMMRRSLVTMANAAKRALDGTVPARPDAPDRAGEGGGAPDLPVGRG